MVVHLLLALLVHAGADGQTMTVEVVLLLFEESVELFHSNFVVVACNSIHHVSVTFVRTDGQAELLKQLATGGY